MKRKEMVKLVVILAVCVSVLVFGLVVFSHTAEAPEQESTAEATVETEAEVRITEPEREETSEELVTNHWNDYSSTEPADPVPETEEELYQYPDGEVLDDEPAAVYDTDDSFAYPAEDSYEVVAPVELPEDPVAVNYGMTDEEINEIARITYLETGCLCDYYTVYLTACVIINRYLDWGYNSISEVIYAPGQYATANKYDDWGGGVLRINERTWQAVYDAIADPDRNPHYQMGKGYNHQIYYADPDWDVCFYY